MSNVPAVQTVEGILKEKPSCFICGSKDRWLGLGYEIEIRRFYERNSYTIQLMCDLCKCTVTLEFEK